MSTSTHVSPPPPWSGENLERLLNLYSQVSQETETVATAFGKVAPEGVGFPPADRWTVLGWLDDAVLDVSWTLMYLLQIRMHANGSVDEADSRLMSALGGTSDD